MEKFAPASWFFSHWKKVVFSLVAAITLYDVYMDEGYILHPHSPDWEFYYSIRHPLIPHVMCAVTTIVLGPIQFSRRIRRRNPRLHRTLGMIYLGAVLVAASLAIYMERNKPNPYILIATETQSSLWIVTTLMAYFQVWRGRILQHRQWMVRSYCVTCLFVVGKAMLHIPWLPLVRGQTLSNIMMTLQLLALLIPDVIFAFYEPAARSRSDRQLAARQVERRALAGER